MARLKVHELAKELGVESRDVLNFLKKENIEVTNHMSAVPEDSIELVRKAFSSGAPSGDHSGKEGKPSGNEKKPGQTESPGQKAAAAGTEQKTAATEQKTPAGGQKAAATGQKTAATGQKAAPDGQKTGAATQKTGSLEPAKKTSAPAQKEKQMTQNHKENPVPSEKNQKPETKSETRNETHNETHNDAHAETHSEAHTESAEQKKKRPAFVFRPQNSTGNAFPKKTNGGGSAQGMRNPSSKMNGAHPVPRQTTGTASSEKEAGKTQNGSRTGAEQKKQQTHPVSGKAEGTKTPAKESAAKQAPAKTAAAKAAQQTAKETQEKQAVSSEPVKKQAPAKTEKEHPFSTADAIRAAKIAEEEREKEAEKKREEARKAAEEFQAAEAARKEEAERLAKERAARAAAAKQAQKPVHKEAGERRSADGSANRSKEGGGAPRKNAASGPPRRDGAQAQRTDSSQNTGRNRTQNAGREPQKGQGREDQGSARRQSGMPDRARDAQSPAKRRDAAPSRSKDSLSQINAKNTDNRKAVNKKRDKDRAQHDSGPKKQENTRNLTRTKPVHKQEQKPPVKKEDEIRTLTLPDSMTIKDLADSLKISAASLVKELFLKGEMVTINSEIDFDKAEEIAMEHNCICEHEEKVDVIAELLKDTEDPEETLVPRPPVVCVMGHVDHGKTSLLDAIRQTHVTEGEAGGITQKIGAYVVECKGQKITFLDTPGHEAFTAMRMRGAQSTDIAILVVAADDGVMPQTVEAINHAKAANVDVIVAINKIDKPGANIDLVKNQLSEHGLVPEDWGGDTVCVPVSARTKEGIDTLLEMILLVAEVKELKANPKRLARGVVIEAQLDKGRGPVATVLIQKGTLHVGDYVAAGACHGKVRAMLDDNGRRVKEAGPSVPVEILGLDDVPNAGEIFVETETEKDARNFAETFISDSREKMIENSKMSVSLESLFDQIQAGSIKHLNLIVKADVQGSVEAVTQSLEKLSNEEVVVSVIHGAVGEITESDVTLASASDAIIIGFNVKPDPPARALADEQKVDVRLYDVIYQAIEDVENAMKGMLEPIYEEQVTGHAEIRQIFKASGIGNIAGSYVTDGLIRRGSLIRITREGTQIYEGSLASLRRFKDDVREVREGYECGLVFDKFNDIKEEDEIEAYTMVEVPR